MFTVSEGVQIFDVDIVVAEHLQRVGQVPGLILQEYIQHRRYFENIAGIAQHIGGGGDIIDDDPQMPLSCTSSSECARVDLMFPQYVWPRCKRAWLFLYND